MISRNVLSMVLVLAYVGSAWAKVEATIGPVPVDRNENLSITMPTTKNSEILISRDQYLIDYNKTRRAPNWVAWKLEADQIGKVTRSNKFQQDADLEKYLVQNGNQHAVAPTDYKNSCFDRGHQIPSGDRTDTEADNQMTFQMSNMIPQTPYLNRVVWEHLENYTRELVEKEGKKVFVIAGPVYDEDFGMIGPNHDIPVPSKDFKIIFMLDANQTSDKIDAKTPYIAVLMPNILKNGQNPVPDTPNCGGGKDESSSTSKDDWKQYATTIADVEKISGITFHGL